MIILPQVRELQKGNLTDLNGTGGSLPTGNYKNITGTFSSVGSDCTSVIALNFNATITSTGTAVTSPYTYNYPSTWSRITTNDYTSIPSVTLNSGSNGTPGGTGGGGGGAAGGGATASGNGGAGGPGGCGAFGVKWDEVPVFIGISMNNTAYACPGLGGSGGTGAAGSPSINGVNGYPGNNGVPPIISNKIYSWGANNSGQMGIGFSSLSPTCTPTAICSSLNFFCMSRSQTGSVYALTTDCKLYVWGFNGFGQLGVCNTINRCLPENICPNCNFNRICLTSSSAYVFGTDNKLYSTGRNHVGQLGDGTTTDRVALFNICSSCQFNNIRTDVRNDESWAPGVSLFAFDVNNKLLAWGCNNCGQLGNGNTTNQCAPVAICSTCTFKCIYPHCCFTTAAIDSNDKLFLWGNNNVGQVGNGNITTQCLPVAICPSCNFRHITLDIGIANTYTYALGTDWKLYTWGDNSVGQLGNGNTTNQCLPVAICPSCNFICVYTRCATSFALTTDYKLFAWGCNNNGRLGDGTITNRCLPTAICTACSFRNIFQSWDSSSTYALGVDDRLYAWGLNNCGQLGNGNIISQCLPVAICSACRFKCIFVPPSANYVFVVDVNNKIYSWGQNSSAELGYGNLISQCLPSIVCDNLLFVDNNVLIKGSDGVSIITTTGGNSGLGGNTYTVTAPAGGIGGAGGGGGGGGQSIFCRYSYPSYIAQNLDALPTPNARFHGNGGAGASGNTSGATAGGTGLIPAPSWPATTSRSGSGGAAGTASPVANATAGQNGGCIITAGPGPMPSSGSPGDLGSPSDTCTFGGAGTAGGNASPGANGTGTSAGSTGSVGGTGGIGTFPSAGGGGGGRGGTGGSGVIQALGANGGAGGAGSSGGAGGKAGKTLALMVYNSACGSIFTYGGLGSAALPGTPGSIGQSCTHPNNTSYSGACGGNGGVGGTGGDGSSGRILLVGRCTVFCTNTNFCANGVSEGTNGNNGTGDKLYTWGDNICGILGDGTTTTKYVLTNICNSLDFNCMVSDTCTVFALTCSRKLYAWGVNDSGQLGNGNTTNQCSPVAICSSLNFKCVLACCKTIYALTDCGSLYTWGFNAYGQLGTGDCTNKCLPTNICPQCTFNVIVNVQEKGLAIDTNRKLYEWGLYENAYPTVLCPNIKFSCAFLNANCTAKFALGVDCKLYAWGRQDEGQLGNGVANAFCTNIENICSSLTFNCVFSHLATTFALTTTNKLYAWGNNSVGQLGTGDTTSRCVPFNVCSACSFNQITYDCIFKTTYAIGTDCKLYGWGCNVYGQLATGNTTNQTSPVAICSACSFICICANNGSAFALGVDCKLYSWGNNSYGQLVTGNTINQCALVAICTNCFFNCIVIGDDSVYALGIDGRLYAAGRNTCGQIGNNSVVNQCGFINICSNLYFSGICSINASKNVFNCGCIGMMAIANVNNGAGGAGGAWSSFATLTCGTVGCQGIRGNGGAGGKITSATPGESSVYYLI